MVQEFDPQGKLHLTRASQGTARDVLHVSVEAERPSARALARIERIEVDVLQAGSEEGPVAGLDHEPVPAGLACEEH
jgi:hypothetical protein